MNVTLYSFSWDYSGNPGLFEVIVYHISGILIDSRDMVVMYCSAPKGHVAICVAHVYLVEEVIVPCSGH
jgi:hypothetical protein